MKRGTSVGHVYVSATVDGSGMNEDIVEGVDEAGPGVEKAGDEHGERYGDKFGDALGARLRGTISRRLGEALADRIEKAGAGAGASAGTSAGKNVVDAMGQVDGSRGLNGMFSDDVIDRLGQRIGKRMSEAVNEAIQDRFEDSISGMLDDLNDIVKAAKLGRKAAGGGSGAGGGGGSRGGSPMFPGPDPDDRFWEMTKRLNAEFDRRRTIMLAAAARMDEAYDRKRTVQLDRAYQMNARFDQAQIAMLARALAMNERFDKNRTTMLDRAYKMNEAFDRKRDLMIDRAYKMNEAFDLKRERMVDRAYEMNEKFDRDRYRMLDAAHKMNLAFDRTRTKMLAEAYRLNAGFDQGKVGGDGRAVSGNRGGGDDDLSNRIGRLFGAGSRSNILNLLGKTIGNVIKMTSRLGNVAQATFATFTRGMASAGQGASLFARLTAGAGAVGSKALASMAAAAPAAAAGLAAVAATMAILVSVGGALLGILAALASTIVSGLTGGLMVLGGVLTSVIAAAGLATIAFTSMTEAQKTLFTEAFQPLRDGIAGLGQIMLQEMVPAFGIWSANLQNAFALVIPLAERMGGAFARAGNTITAAFSGPGFQMLINSLTTYLPGIVENLSRALGGFLNGLSAVFAALMPSVNRFAGYLANVAARFAEWASSAQGQNAIADFVDRALKSFESLWNFTREFVGWFMDVLFSPEAQSFGNSMFDALAESFEGFRQSIADGSLQKWFADAIEFGSAAWSVITALADTLMNLYNSGVLEAVGTGFEAMAFFISGLNTVLGPLIDGLGRVLPTVAVAAVTPLEGIVIAVLAIGEAIEEVLGKVNIGDGAEWDTVTDKIENLRAQWSDALGVLNDGGGGGGYMKPGLPLGIGAGLSVGDNIGTGTSSPNWSDLLGRGREARNNTLVDNGGFMREPEYVNPYVKWAQWMIDKGPSSVALMKQAFRDVNKDVRKALRQAAKSSSLGEAREILGAQSESMREASKQLVEDAYQARSSAAQSLANATSPEAAAKALRAVRQAQRDYDVALKRQRQLNRVADRIDRQQVLNQRNVQRLLNGAKVNRATLADYASARAIVARQLERANERLVEAVALRDDYKVAVVESTRTFGSILTAQAQTINGVQQALTANDITDNLRERLDRIRNFQVNLRKLLAMGLSNDAYKQLVDAGVEQGGAYAEALLSGGQGSISGVNELTKGINAAAEQLGAATSSRLYQSGVDAAQGLVDGLESLSGKLDRAAVRLGNSIAAAIKKSLKIKSPSQVMRDLMDPVGDGAVVGLNAQEAKVAAAANKLASNIDLSPTTNRGYPSGPDPVSGNGGSPLFRDFVVQTPTEDPKAVAHEALNELTARL